MKRRVQKSVGRIGRCGAAVAAGAFGTLTIPAGTAQAQTWLYAGTDYGTGSNWSTGVTPGAGQTATFNQAGANQPVVNGNFTIGTVGMTAGSLTLNATRTLTVQSAYSLTDASILGSGTLSLGAGSLLTAAGNSAVVISPVISGSGAALITGSNVTFTGANTFTGATTIGPGGQLQSRQRRHDRLNWGQVPSPTTAACRSTAPMRLRWRTPSRAVAR